MSCRLVRNCSRRAVCEEVALLWEASPKPGACVTYTFSEMTFSGSTNEVPRLRHGTARGRHLAENSRHESRESAVFAEGLPGERTLLNQLLLSTKQVVSHYYPAMGCADSSCKVSQCCLDSSWPAVFPGR